MGQDISEQAYAEAKQIAEEGECTCTKLVDCCPYCEAVQIVMKVEGR